MYQNHYLKIKKKNFNIKSLFVSVRFFFGERTKFEDIENIYLYKCK